MPFLRSSIIALSVGTVVASAANMPASAQGASPIKITACTVLQYRPSPAYRRWYWNDYGPTIPAGSPFTDGLAITYVNVSDKVADRIVFGVNYRGDSQRVIDAGTFSPGAQIDHTFADIFSGYAYLGPHPNSCVARVVRFKDGSVWRAPGVPPRRQQ